MKEKRYGLHKVGQVSGGKGWLGAEKTCRLCEFLKR